VVGAIAPWIEKAEIERARLKPTDSLDAYDYYLRGLALVDRVAKETTEEALRLFNQAIRYDPDFALAHARAAHCYVYRRVSAWTTDRVSEDAQGVAHARRAIELGRDDAVALSYGGFALCILGELEDGAAFIERALALNANLAAAWAFSGW